MRNYGWLIIFALLVPLASWGNCYDSNKPIQDSRYVIDLSDKFNSDIEYISTHNTDFPSTFEFTCSTDAKLGYGNYLYKPQILSFHGGKYFVEVTFIDEGPDMFYAKAGRRYTGSDLNRSVKMKFALKNYGGWKGAGYSSIDGVILIVSDTSSLGWWQWARRFIYNIFTWGSWKHENGDMFRHLVRIIYNPKMTTCSLDNSVVQVVLPSVGVAQVKSSMRPGYREFALGVSCDQFAAGNVSGRGIDMFLSSNNLSASSNTVLHDSSSGSASGVGIQLVKAETPDRPVVISRSSTVRGNATSLFRVARGEALKDRFTIKMGAYYHVVDKNKVSAGEINTSAMLNIVYD